MKIIMLLLITIFLSPTFAYADSPYYEKGFKAVEEKDHVNTIKYLFAFKVLNNELLKKNENKKLLDAIDKHIKYAENQLKSLIVEKDIKPKNTVFHSEGVLRDEENAEFELINMDK